MSDVFKKLHLFALFGLVFAAFTIVNTPIVKAEERDVCSSCFLTPPYFGTKVMTAIFDHEYPTKYTSMQPPDVVGSVVNRDGSRQTNPATNPCARYSGHAGIDYGMFYDYVLATHDGQVTQADWSNPQDRRTGLGLRVEVEITLPNQERYRTRYGHLSTLFVEQGQNVTQQNLLGISGNTGNSTGPHLHFEVQKWFPADGFNWYPVNPYGWVGNTPDPWENAYGPGSRPVSVNLWKMVPSITSSHPNRCSYPSGPALPSIPYPPLTPNFSYPNLIVDDLNPRFHVYGVPWRMLECHDWFGACFGTTYRTNRDPAPNDRAVWELYQSDLLGYYDVYAFIPREYADSSLAYYEIHHSGQILSAGIDQSRFNKVFPANPWAYLGRYNFSQLSSPQQAVRVYHTLRDDKRLESLGADAVVFVMADGPPSLILPISQGSNDAGPNPGGLYPCSFSTGFPEIYFGHCNNGTAIVSGFRYGNVNVPAGATIIRAHLEFVVDGPYDAPLQLRFYGDNNPASPPFSNSNRPQHRPLTDTWITWNIPAADEWLNFRKRVSPNLASIVQELVDHPGWTQGQSALTFIVRPAPNFSAISIAGLWPMNGVNHHHHHPANIQPACSSGMRSKTF